MPLGGPGSRVPVAGSAGALAWLGVEGGEVFVQPAPGAGVHCNGTRLTASHWLRDGDSLRLGPTRVEVVRRGNDLRLVVAALADDNPTEPPVVLVPPPRDERLGPASDAAPIRPIEYRPRGAAAPGRRHSGPARRVLVLAALLLGSAAVLSLVSRLSLVTVVVEPAPDTMGLMDGPPAFRLGSRFLALAGRYTLVAAKEGYHPLQAPVEAKPASGTVIRHALRLLPARVTVDTGGVAGAEVLLDGRSMGTTPLAAFDAEAGDREVRVRASGYEDFAGRVAVEGGGREMRLDVALVPLPPPPKGAAPAPAPAVLVLRSEPPGARVALDGVDRGETPLEVRLEPGRDHSFRLAKAGHDEAEVVVRPRAGARQEETVRLAPQVGEVRVAGRPPDAELLVDGEPRGRADQTLRLLAVPHMIEARREGYEPARETVTPRPGFPQTVTLVLRSREQARAAAAPAVVHSPEGHELRLVAGGTFKLGAPRREPGRRSNEPLRDVVLSRRFYVATREVSNSQFRRFAPGHTSGRLGTETLDLDDQPVVRVSWQDAAAYCNWLSEREGLPKAYAERGGSLVAGVPLGVGYRLPTEAEWERVARYPDGREALKYAWGPALPVPPGGGNYADERARGLVARVLEGLDDGHAASAPVASFAPNALGFFHLGGNVAEWVHDVYALMPSVEGQLVRDPVGPAEGAAHVVRGASFLHATVSELRLSARERGTESRPDLGFRVARYAEAAAEPGPPGVGP